MTEPITLRASVLIEQAHAIAARFDAIGRHFSADLTRGFARDMEAGVSSALFEHWLKEQAALVAEMELVG